MNQARETINAWVNGIVAASFPTWNGGVLITGDEKNPVAGMKSIAIDWPGGEFQGRKPESVARLFQIEVFVGDRNTDAAESACDMFIQAVGLESGKNPVVSVPLKDFTAGRPGVDTGRTIDVYLLNGKRWTRTPGTNHSSRFYALTLVVDYTP